MQYTEDREVIAEWAPLIVENRDPADKIAMTRMDIGTDVNFGALTRSLFAYLAKQPGVTIHLQHEVRDVQRNDNGKDWNIKVKNMDTGDKRWINTEFVFIGAGGGALHLLEKVGHS